ncbi:MAG: hypothetical protein PVG39_16315 [Desulfobacteraceae bacterium]|jgi:hypothetical protein
MVRKAEMVLLVLGTVVLICVGCNTTGTGKTEWKPAEPVNRPPYIHTVKYPGETLRIISKWYTGDVSNWEALADANPNIDYENMIKGSRIFIPGNLLKTRDPLTAEFIDSYLQKSKPKVKKEKKKPVIKPKPRPEKKDEDFDLIGPK